MTGLVRGALRDFVVLGVVGGGAGWLWGGPKVGLGFLLGCLWLAFNTLSLSWTIRTLTIPGSNRLLGWLALCAKIPVAYLILLWLVSNAYTKPIAVVAALATLPVVLLFEGLAAQSAAPSGQRNEKEVC